MSFHRLYSASTFGGLFPLRLPRQWSLISPIACTAVVVSCAVLFAQTPTIPTLAMLYESTAAERYAEAQQQAQSIMQFGVPEVQLKASLVYGRLLLGSKQKEAARKYLSTMAKEQLRAEERSQMDVYSAWLAALNGKPDDAIKTLEAIVQKNPRAAVTADAADVLALLYLGRGEKEQAQRAVDRGLQVVKYLDLRTGYIESLLRQRMHRVDEPEKAYLAAEELRRQEKYVEAFQSFGDICRQSPLSEWSNPARFRAGQCLASLRRLPEAIELWKKFVGEKPAGPWRGQAYIALIDAGLQAKLNAAFTSEQVTAAVAVLNKPLLKESEPSWGQAAFEIYLRQGVLAFVDRKFAAAATATQKAKQSASAALLINTGQPPCSDTLSNALRHLAAPGEGRSGILPDDAMGGDVRIVIALALGHAYRLLGSDDTAQHFLDIALTGRGRSSFAPHRSFAALELARLATCLTPSPDSKDSRFDKSRQYYQLSLKEYARASWHDDTLRELAVLFEREAAENHPMRQGAPESAANGDSGGDGSPARQALSATERRRPSRLLAAARAKALPLWTDLAARYPKSRHMPEALYHAGVLLAEAHKADDAFKSFEDLIARFPRSHWTGDAQIWLIDVKLEQQFDLQGAAKLARAALTWHERPSKVHAVQADPAASDDGSSSLRSLQQVGYDIYVRAGLLEHLQGHRDQSLLFLEKAKPLEPRHAVVAVGGHVPTGVERLIRLAKSDESPTPDLVKQGDQKASLILMLADVYHEGQQYDKAVRLCTLVATQLAHTISPDQRSYAFFRRGRSYYLCPGGGFDCDAALADYTAAIMLAPNAPWADAALFFAGNIQWNHKHNPPAAVAAWERLLRDYPNSAEADRCSLYIGAVYYYSQRYSDAQRSLTRFLKTYPKSEFVESASAFLDDCRAKATRSTKRASDKEL